MTATAKTSSKRLKAASFSTESTGRRLPIGIMLIIALIAGAGFSLSLAPFYLYPIAIISPMVLYALLINADNPRQAFWLGEFYGFGTWAVGAFWLFTSIHKYGNIPEWLALIMIGLMAAIMGLFHAVMAWAFVRFVGRQPLAFASLWVIQEWAKTWLLTGFPWLFVGYAFTEVSWLSGLAPVTGVFGLSFVAVLFGAATIELFRRRGGYMLIAAPLTLVVAVLSWAGISWTTPTGKALTVSLLQGNIPQDQKWLQGFRQETLDIYTDLSSTEWGRDLVVWPEAAIPLFANDIAPFMGEVATVAGSAGSTWLTGVPYREMASGEPKFYNSVLAMKGSEMQIYRKQRLVPFGEYIPFHGVLDILPNLAGMQLGQGFSAGDSEQTPLLIKGLKLGMAICYEVAYPNTTRLNAKDTDILVTISNDAWFGASAGPMQHLQMVQMRSLELGRYFVRGTNNGVTAIINEKGQVVASLPQFERAVLRGEALSFTGNTPYALLGSYPVLAISLLLLLLSSIAKIIGGAKTARKEKYYAAAGVRD